MRNRDSCHRAVPLLLVSFIVGCGDGRPVRLHFSGRILIDGRPMEFGLIQITPRGSRAASSVIDSDGRFTLSSFDLDDGCVAGEHPVTIDGRKSLGATRVQWFAPPRYAFAGTSGLTIVVDRPRDDVLIEIQTGGDEPFEPYTEVLSRGEKDEDSRTGDSVF